MVRVFLDQISNFAHLPEDAKSKEESWRNTLVQPVRIPDIEHIHVKTSLLTTLKRTKVENHHDKDKNIDMCCSSLWYPDGSVALELREQISRQVQLTVCDVNVDHDDVQIRDMQRKKRRKKKKIKDLQQ